MQFFSSAIVTTLVIFLLLLPSFIVLRVFWGKSRGALHADNIYRYLIWGLPISLGIYFAYYITNSYISADFRKNIPTEAIWNLFADSANNVGATTSTSKIITTNVITDSIFEVTLLSKASENPAFDTVRVITYDSASGQWTTTYSYVLSKRIGSSKSYIRQPKKLLRTALDTMPPLISSSIISTPRPSLFISKRFLLKHLFFITAICFLLSLVFKKAIYVFGLDKIEFLKLESGLYYILSGRQETLDNSKIFHATALRKLKYEVQVDLLCQVGTTIKIYRGIVCDFKVRDDCLLYIVLEDTHRGNFLSEKTEKDEEIIKELKSKYLAHKKPSIDLGSVAITPGKVAISIGPSEILDAIRLLKTPSDFDNPITDLYFTEIKGDKIFFKNDEIKNINIKYWQLDSIRKEIFSDLLWNDQTPPFRKKNKSITVAKKLKEEVDRRENTLNTTTEGQNNNHGAGSDGSHTN